jgi:hypothetical protein
VNPSDQAYSDTVYRAIAMNAEEIQETMAHHRALANELRKRLRILEQTAAKFGELYVPPHIQSEIDDIKAKLPEYERLVGDNRLLLQKQKRKEKTIRMIRQYIMAGNKDAAIKLSNKLGDIDEEQNNLVKRLISREARVHVQSILTNGELNTNAQLL